MAEKQPTTTDTTGSPWLAELYLRFAPVRQEAIDRGYTEEDINRAIDAAITAVRQMRSRASEPCQ